MTPRLAARLIPSLLVSVSLMAPLPLNAQQEERASPAVAPPAGGAPAEEVPDAVLSGRYRITPGDVLEFTFRNVPELSQVLTVQPDGYISLREAGEIRAQGHTVPELHQMVFDAYEPILREPVITIVLKDFEKPYFVVSGQVKTPGKYELRGALTLTQAVAIAGGFTPDAKSSQVVLFRRYTQELLEVKQIDLKGMLARRDLSEDPLVRPGDTILIPKSFMATLKPYLPTASIGLYLNPFGL